MRGYIRCATNIKPLRRLIGETEQTHGSPIRIRQSAIRRLGRGMSPIHMQLHDTFLGVGETRIRRIGQCRRLPSRTSSVRKKTGTDHPPKMGSANRHCEDPDVSSWRPPRKTSPSGSGPFSTSRALYQRSPRSNVATRPIHLQREINSHSVHLQDASGKIQVPPRSSLSTPLYAKPLEYPLPTNKARIPHYPRQCPPASPLQIAYRPTFLH